MDKQPKNLLHYTPNISYWNITLFYLDMGSLLFIDLQETYDTLAILNLFMY